MLSRKAKLKTKADEKLQKRVVEEVCKNAPGEAMDAKAISVNSSREVKKFKAQLLNLKLAVALPNLINYSFTFQGIFATPCSDAILLPFFCVE